MATRSALEERYSVSLTDPKAFWGQAAEAISWDEPPLRTVAPRHRGLVDWFPGGKLNTCFNAVDRHVRAGRGDQIALIYDSPVTNQVRRFRYADLQSEVARLAGAIRSLGVRRGDRVVIYLPMVPEAVFAMLACARLGAVHSVVFGGFAAAELAKRIDDAKPTLVLSASCGIEPGRVVAYKPLLDAALERATHRIDHALILQRPQLRAAMAPSRDVDWHEALARAQPCGCESLNASDPLYILYTSGTTGVPKGVVRDNGGHAVALAWSMRHVFDVAAGDVFWAASDIGWVVGHSYIVYAPLIAGCTTVLYEGKPVGTPDAGAFWRVVRDHDVQTLFTSPTALRAIKREDPNGAHIARGGLGRLDSLFLAGERADPDTLQWAERHLQRPVIDHWWQTELGWPAIATCRGLGETRVRHGSAGRPVPGFRFSVLDAAGTPQVADTVGALCIELPLPPGCLPTLWNADDAFNAAYLQTYPGYYLTGDSGRIDADGFVHVMSRIDDIINVAGHRLSSGGIEQVMAAHPDVAECAAIGAHDAIKGMVPLGFIVLKAGTDRAPSQIAAEVSRRVREEIGAIAACKAVLVVDKLPKTRSGKVLRSSIRKLADGESFETPATIEDPAALEFIRAALQSAGYPLREVSHDS